MKANNLRYINSVCKTISIKCMALVFLMISQLALAQDENNVLHITSPITGIVDKVSVKPGKEVKKGDLLLIFDLTLINSQLKSASALKKQADFDFEEAKKELERAKELYDRTVLSDHDLQKAHIFYQKAYTEQARAHHQLVKSQWYKKHSKLYAPHNGKIIKLSTYSGQYVNNNHSAQTLMLLQTNR